MFILFQIRVAKIRTFFYPTSISSKKIGFQCFSSPPIRQRKPSTDANPPVKQLLAYPDTLPAGRITTPPLSHSSTSFFLHLSQITRYTVRCLSYNNRRTNIRQGLRQTYNPPPRRDAFFPNASHWAEQSRPLLLMVNCHAGYMIWRVTRITITRRGYKPELFQPHPSKGWGIDIRTLFGGLKA